MPAALLAFTVPAATAALDVKINKLDAPPFAAADWKTGRGVPFDAPCTDRNTEEGLPAVPVVMIPGESGRRDVTTAPMLEVGTDEAPTTLAAFALLAIDTLNNALSEEIAATIALMLDVTAEPESTSIGVPAVSVGMDWTASTPAPTSFDFMVMIWLQELITV